MEKKQTAVNQFIKRLQSLHIALPTNTAHNRAVKGAYVHAIMIAKEYLQMEREQIEEAFNAGDCNGTFETINRKQYYTKTFKP